MIPTYVEMLQEPITIEQRQEMDQEIDAMLAEVVKTLESANINE